MDRNRFDKVILPEILPNLEDENLLIPKFKHGEIVIIEDEWWGDCNHKKCRIYTSCLYIIGKSTEKYPNGCAIIYDVFIGDNDFTIPIFEESLIKYKKKKEINHNN